MAGLGEHITAMVRSHASGDDSAFYSVALQVAAREARQGHHVLADDIKKAVDASRSATPSSNVTKLAPAARGPGGPDRGQSSRGHPGELGGAKRVERAAQAGHR